MLFERLLYRDEEIDNIAVSNNLILIKELLKY